MCVALVASAGCSLVVAGDSTDTDSDPAADAGANAGECSDVSLDFDGADDFVRVPQATLFTVNDNFTVSAWVLVESIDGFPTIASAGDFGVETGWSLYIDGPAVEFYLSETCQVNAQVTLGRWTHVAASRFAGRVRIFLDGFEASAEDCIGSGAYAGPLIIGALPGAGEGDFFNGALDDFVLRRGAQMVNFVPAPPACNGSETIWFPFDETGSQEVVDFCGAANKGTLGNDLEPDNADPTWRAEDECTE